MEQAEIEMVLNHAREHLKAGHANVSNILRDLNVSNYSPREVDVKIVNELRKTPGIINEGWELYLDPKYNEESALLTDKKLRVDLKNAERLARSYPFTQAIAWVSFLIALILGFLKITEALKLWPYHK